jgi:hypothetical protein
MPLVAGRRNMGARSLIHDDARMCIQRSPYVQQIDGTYDLPIMTKIASAAYCPASFDDSFLSSLNSNEALTGSVWTDRH